MQQPAPDITKEVGRRIASREPCWFPGLAGLLVAGFWDEAPALDADDYSTAGWLGGLPLGATLAVPGQEQMIIEPLPAAFRLRFQVPASAAAAPEAAHAIAGAMERLAPMGASEAVVRLVRSVHWIAARASGYDCSHSEPSIPFSIFVSLPLGERHAELRLAESLLHEAMHLQLTLIERHAPISGGEAGGAYSPWQQCERPVEGLLHGLYVFAAIYQWLHYLAADPALPPDDSAYVDRRLREIVAEIRAVEELGSEPHLSDFGRSLSTWLLAPFRVSTAGGAAELAATG